MPETRPRPSPGPELDALVAVLIFKWTWAVFPEGRYLLPPTHKYFNAVPRANLGDERFEQYWADQFAQGYAPMVPPFSISIAAAWEVVEKFTPVGIAVHCCRRAEWGDARWRCIIAVSSRMAAFPWSEVVASADTAPHAICLAALKACEVGTQ